MIPPILVRCMIDVSGSVYLRLMNHHVDQCNEIKTVALSIVDQVFLHLARGIPASQLKHRSSAISIYPRLVFPANYDGFNQTEFNQKNNQPEGI